MMTSKYIGFFLEEISSWQKKLSVVDTVISLWFDVQRTWSHLESIFIGSEDIRKQLPADSQRFDEIDTEFKELMVTLAKTANVVQVRKKTKMIQHLNMNVINQCYMCSFCAGHECEGSRGKAGDHPVAAVLVREGLGRISGDQAAGLPQVLLCLVQ